MKTLKLNKKLELNKQTVAHLEEEYLEMIRGGARTNGNGTTCNSCVTACRASDIDIICPC
ncbi:MAG: hypothetical protein GY940_31185 [bacterium]|nr:hypothetical protein [bacterium]